MTMKNQAVVVSLLCGGCLIPQNLGHETFPDATLDEHLRRGRPAEIGVIDRDLSAPSETRKNGADQEETVAIASASGIHIGFSSRLEYMGTSEAGQCFSNTYRVPASRNERAAELAATVFSNLFVDSASGAWLTTLPSLDAVTGRAAWPPPPGSTRFTEYTVLGDEVREVTKRVGDDDVVVKQRVVKLAYCAKLDPLDPATKFVLLVEHKAPDKEHDKSMEVHAYDRPNQDERPDAEAQHDAVYLWEVK